MEHALNIAVRNVEPVEFILPTNGDKIKWKIGKCAMHRPEVNSIVSVKTTKIYPTECRQRAATYKGLLTGSLNWWVNDQPRQTLQINFGEIPIMVKSKFCHLYGLSPKELVKHGEDEDVWGGYFVVKGNERLIRMLVQTRANYPVAMQRGGWKNRGAQFSEIGVLVRCVATDLRVTNNVLHFVNDGTSKLMFSLEKVLYFVPLMLVLKSCLDVTDEYIFQQLTLGCEDDLYYHSCVITMLRQLHEDNIHSHAQAKDYFGKTFRIKIKGVLDTCTGAQLCDYLFRQSILIHLPDPADKFHFLCLMSRKLYSFARSKCKQESTDTVMMQEVQLGGFLYLQYITERLQLWSRRLRAVITKKSTQKVNNKADTLSDVELLKMIRTCAFENVMESFLATGNISSISGMGLMQDKGLTIVPENINRMRYMSHFKAVHRGSFFLTMRTTEARQLLPDAWGFICPVHTPDGAPCGLLNHLTRNCRIVTTPCNVDILPELLVSLGMTPLATGIVTKAKNHYFITLDGKVMGIISHEMGPTLVNKMRLLKALGDRVPQMLEIVLVPHEDGIVGQYPGIFLFSAVSRMMRPVMQLASQKIEMIGTFEQVYLNIAMIPEEIIPGVTTHLEISETSFLSNLACLIPLPDCNQSPRNMYQCQMGKQSMGTPVHTWHLQSECKLYRLQTPSSPLFRPAMYDAVELDNHPMGVNAIVAVISYTGYDMEDAMIINKSSYERGFAHGSIYKSEFIDISPGSYFMRDPDRKDLNLDVDGLPYVGSILNENDAMACYFDRERSCFKVMKYHGKEQVYVDHVKQCGTPVTSNVPQPSKACITFRVPRNPSVGDKFASRAGQKGICSQKWPAEDLPFTESGIVPDIVFNPHGFPSRMTIAMMVELMAGKSAAIHGLVHDATPFRFSEDDTAINYFGTLLKEAGYNHHGTERMYSGVDGREMKADIFFGVVYYQRLRHMVSDKWQVRSTGPVDAVTHQPLKGRRRGGGVRFGEMERDALISHGAAFLLQDRLFHCSDKSLTGVCTKCGSMLAPITATSIRKDQLGTDIEPLCQACGEQGKVEQVQVPHVLRLLAAQLASF
ncbi:hypothetical protein B566_EDAN009232 [Ephemera danica]|nr:hypothetical protein B566_EDAN009232 [Ephemera danica]